MGSRTSPRAGSRSPAWPSCQMSANPAVATKRGRLRMPPERRGGGGPACGGARPERLIAPSRR